MTNLYAVWTIYRDGEVMARLLTPNGVRDWYDRNHLTDFDELRIVKSARAIARADEFTHRVK